MVLPSFEEVRESKRTYAESFAIQYKNTDAINAKPMAEPYEGQGYIVQNPPSRPLTEQEMDDVYALPYMRAYHPSYEKDGGVPALGEIKYSLTSNRGCFGSCSFCALTFHEGRVVQTRSHESILAEARQMLVVLQPISGSWHAKSSSPKAPARTGTVSSRSRVKIWWQITEIM